MKMISIDPSMREVGWAMVDGLRYEDYLWDDSEAKWSFGMWKIGSNTLQFKLQEIVEYIILDCGGLDPEEDWLIMEWPAYFDEMRGHIAAKQGYTLNLAGICCYIAGYFRLPWRNWHVLTAVQWKGSVNKEITRRRFFHKLGIKQIYKVDHNAVDAVMLLHTFCERKNIPLKAFGTLNDFLDQVER